MQATIARRIVLAFAALGLIVTSVATIRLGAIVASTPAYAWLVKYPRLVNLSQPISPETALRADAIAKHVSDPFLFHARQSVCVSVITPNPNETGEIEGLIDECIRVIDEALEGNPASGELWLFRANMLLMAREAHDLVFEALRRSYQSTPREGWIAAERMVLGLKFYPLLPSDLQAHVRSDLEIVLIDERLSKPLVDAYPDESALRSAASEALRSLPPDILNRFTRMVQKNLKERATNSKRK